jgi:hypothetical protein
MILIKKLFGVLITISGIILFLALSFIRKSDGIRTYNIFDMVLNLPPEWAYFIPFVDFIYELFSLHGLLVLFSLILSGIGYSLYKK